MKVYAISDLHLSGANPKPMTVFGEGWDNHFEKIKADWQNQVTDDDLVLISGDVSWGLTFEEGLYDLQSLVPLAGKKVFIRGNHDYWWNGITRLRRAAPEGFYFLQNDCARFGNLVVVGSRGWTCPGSADYTENDARLYMREAERFKLCFKAAEKILTEGDELIAMIHYPPFSPKSPDTLFTDMFREHGVKKVVFGHIHGDTYFPFRTVKDGVEYVLASCDKVGFRLQRIL